jgi:hypothetical protein
LHVTSSFGGDVAEATWGDRDGGTRWSPGYKVIPLGV